MTENSDEIKIVLLFLYLKKDQNDQKVQETIEIIKNNRFPIVSICIDDSNRQKYINKNKEVLTKIQKGPILVQSTFNNSKDKKCKRNTIVSGLSELGSFLENVRKITENIQ